MNMLRKTVMTVALAAIAASAMAWGRIGHEVVIKVAERHLTDRAKANIAKYMPYDLKTDAVWMDIHRNDKPIAYTSPWHTYRVNEQNVYDPNRRLVKGDVVMGIDVADYNLRHWRELTDSAVVMNLRMILHFVGDLHCPTHAYWPHINSSLHKCTLPGTKPEVNLFHGMYDDNIPNFLYRDKESSEAVAARIDTRKKGEIRKIAAGTPVDWAKDCAERDLVIYEWNPLGTYDLNPNTAEMSRPLIETQFLYAGYRLARLLNEYFDN